MSKKNRTKKSSIDPVQEPDKSRRRFLRRLWIGVGIFAGLEFIGVVFAFLRPRRPPGREEDFGGIFEVGQVDDFEPDSVTAFIRGQFYLSRLKDGGFLALSRKCTHLGCTVLWESESEKFHCPCHASAFDITGEVISPPAPRALDLYPLVIENGIVTVDTGKRIKRRGFKISQVVRP
jgi:cytochrome b6-f complex iron-sulfur subunit